MNIFSNGINYADGETPTVMTANIGYGIRGMVL